LRPPRLRKLLLCVQILPVVSYCVFLLTFSNPKLLDFL
jgi:hypothetical protein